jgi:arabinogalactan oligomer/maltooligosaccharide transport system substrate-binding protein
VNTKLQLASLVGAVAIIATACSSGTASTAPSAAAPSAAAPSEQASAAAPTAAPLTGTITIWEAYGASGSAEKDAFDTIVANVKAANPGLNVTVLDVPFNNLFTKFETDAASGGGPDLYIAPNDSLPSEARAGLLKDLSSMSSTLMAAPYNISQTAITADTVDGKLYAIPESMKAVALFYRTDLLPTAPATTDDWMSTLKGGTKLGLVYGPNGGGAYYQWGFYGAFGGKILDDSGKCAATATTGVADSLKFLQDFKAAGGILYQNDTDAKTDFLSGKIAGFIDGPWQTGDLKAALGDKLAVAPGPKAVADFSPMAAPDGYYINDSSANADLAIQFALQMISASNEQIFVEKAGHIPANTTITPTDPITLGFANAIATGFPRPTAVELNNYWGNFGNAIAAVIDKGTDPTTAVADACAAMDKANNK